MSSLRFVVWLLLPPPQAPTSKAADASRLDQAAKPLCPFLKCPPPEYLGCLPLASPVLPASSRLVNACLPHGCRRLGAGGHVTAEDAFPRAGVEEMQTRRVQCELHAPSAPDP